ncbi:XdhC family protein [Streptomyces atratus]|uniref:XdhC family protein n=1 Tax=Streptomyces atratus TaxID=1893 RepID=UPI003407DEF6
MLITSAPADPVHSAITAALADDLSIAVRVGLQPPYTWTVATSTGQLQGAGPGFIEELPRRRRLVLVGATDLAAAVAAMAEPLHRRVVVLDPRPGHATSGAFPSTSTVVRAWPDEWISRHPLDAHDAVVILSHDPRIDDPAIRAALVGNVGHIAVLGSRATHAQRLRRLAATAGIDRLSGPAGLDLGGISPAETALSILAELVAVENGRSGRRLRDGDLPIHVSTTPAHAPRVEQPPSTVMPLPWITVGRKRPR